MVEDRTFPWTDPFSFTAVGSRWLNHEWLAECWTYWLYRLSGIAGLHAVRLVQLFIVLWIVARLAVRLGACESVAALACGVAVLNAQWGYFLDVRPYLFTYLGVALSYYLADLWLRDGRLVWLALLAAMFVMWANLHSGVIVGLALLLAFGLGAIHRNGPRGVALLGMALVCAAVSLVNPFGTDILTFPFEFLRSGTVWSEGLNEWARPSFLGAQWPFLVYMCAVWLCAGLARQRTRMADVLVLGGFSVLACTAWRHLTLFAVVSVPIVALGIQYLLDKVGVAVKHRGVSLHPSPRCSALLTVLTVMLGMGGIVFQFRKIELGALSLEHKLFPVAAVSFLRANPLTERVLNPYGWGGYFDWMLWPRYRVFMDGRANTVFPPDVYDQFLRATELRAGWEQILASHGVRLIVLNQREEGYHRRSSVLARRPDWVCIYVDDIAEIHLHRDVVTAPMLLTWKAGAFWYPTEARLAMARREIEKGKLSEAERRLQPLFRAHEEVAQADALLAIVAVRRGHPREAEKYLRQAVTLDPRLSQAHYNLGALLLDRGDRDGAVRELELAIEIDPDFEEARARLAWLRGHGQ